MENKLIKSVAVIVLSAFLCAIICSCQNIADLSYKDYKYLAAQSLGMDTKIREGFADAAEYGLYTNVEQKVFGEVEKTIVSPFTSQTIGYKYSECPKDKNGSDTVGTFYSVYDVYNSEHEDLMYLHGTGLLCQYFYREEKSLVSTAALSTDEALEAANDFLLMFLSKDQVAGFEPPEVKKESSGTFMYTVSYVRKAAGFDTDETITVFISFGGKVTGYNGKNLGKYDSYADSIKADKVNKAKKRWKQKYNL